MNRDLAPVLSCYGLLYLLGNTLCEPGLTFNLLAKKTALSISRLRLRPCLNAVSRTTALLRSCCFANQRNYITAAPTISS